MVAISRFIVCKAGSKVRAKGAAPRIAGCAECGRFGSLLEKVDDAADETGKRQHGQQRAAYAENQNVFVVWGHGLLCFVGARLKGFG